MNKMYKKFPEFIQKIILSVTDFVSIFISFFVALFIINLFIDPISNFIPDSQFKNRFIIHLVLGLFAVIWFWAYLRHYSHRKSFWTELHEIVKTVLLLSIFELSFLALLKLETSRYVWLLTWLFVLILMPLFRNLVKVLLIRLNLWNKDTFIVGINENAKDAYLAILSEPLLGFKINGFIDIAYEDLSSEFKHITVSNNNDPKTPLANVCANLLPIFNSLDAIGLQYDLSQSQFIIALEQDDINLRDQWIRYLVQKGIYNIFVVPSIRGIPLYGTDMSFFFSHEVFMLRIKNNLARFSSRLIKRSFDLICSAVLLILLSPFMLYIALSIIFSGGGNPIFYHQRIGKNGIKFNCLKFRTMRKDSQEILTNLLATRPDIKEEWEKEFKLKNDPRVTKIGQFLRKTSLDELPQLWNVIKGEMSLVGPRPVIEQELERYEEDVHYYLMSRPGMTGLWQVSGRSDTDYQKRVYFDAWYVKNWSLWNDFVILCKTVKVVFNRNGAY